MLELLYATGIRVSELIGLNVGDVNLPGSYIRCASRGKERVIPLYPGAVKALADYVKEIRPQMVLSPKEQALFVNMSGERMSRQGFWKIIKYYQGKAQIDKDITPHTLLEISSIHLRRTCWRTGRTSAPFRRCWDTQIFLPPRFILIWSNKSCKTFIKKPIPGHEKSVPEGAFFSLLQLAARKEPLC